MFETHFFSTWSPCIGLDSNTYLSLISTKRPGPKAQWWNMTYLCSKSGGSGREVLYFVCNQTFPVILKDQPSK